MQYELDEQQPQQPEKKKKRRGDIAIYCNNFKAN
jgi:hypothetical protein